MIVDDEPIVIKAISHVVEEACPAIQIVGHTGSGAASVAMAIARKPDIILMDIELIGINGLEAIQEIKKVVPETVVVVISAYDNFQYAKKSIELGVMEYLLKPISRNEVIAILDKAVNRVVSQRANMQEHLLLKERVNRLQPFLEEEFFLTLLYPSIGFRTLVEYQQLLELNPLSGQAVSVYLYDFWDSPAAFQDLRSIIKKQLGGGQTVLMGPLIGRILSVLVGYNTAVPETKAVWEKIFRLLQAKGQVRIVLGKTYSGYEGLVRSFQELRSYHLVFSHPPGVFELAEISDLPEKEGKSLVLLELEFYNAAKAGEKRSARLLLEELYEQVNRLPNHDLQSQKDYFAELITTLVIILYEKLPSELRNILEVRGFGRSLGEARDEQGLKLLLEEQFDLIMEKIAPRIGHEKNEEINKALEFIRSHYHQDITLANIAAAVSISPGYLCRLFKEYRKQTVMECLEKYRVEKAVELLKNTDLSVKEVALRVGFKDPNYFSKVFRKVTNSSPTAVRVE